MSINCLRRRRSRDFGRAVLFLMAVGAACGAAAEPAPSVIAPSVEFGGVIRSAIGVTRDGIQIDLFLQQDDVDLNTTKRRVVLIGGHDGDRRSVDAVLALLRWFHDADAAYDFRQQFSLSAVPCARPADLPTDDGVTEPDRLRFTYPPADKAYHSPRQPDEASYLWRWLGMHAADLVIDVRTAEESAWQVPRSLPVELRPHFPAAMTIEKDGDLVLELGRHDVCQTGRIPAIRLQTPAAQAVENLQDLLHRLQASDVPRPSPARRELQRRLERTPLVVARQLAKHYGHDLKQVVYIPAIALIGRVRLGALDNDPQHLAAVRRIVQPYVDGEKRSRPTSGSGLSGHLVFTELAGASSGAQADRFIELARGAADLGFDATGQPQAIMPFHHEMSDAAFMGGPILSAVGRLTHDDRYFEACARHLRSVRELVLRDDGLYRHSPLDEAAWGRGNGFPALALALCLADFPLDHPARPALLEQFQRHLRALARHQDPTGCWHQVIDRPESYRELSSTCMMTYALARGIRSGWLEADEFQPVVERAWQAIRTRVAVDGQLVDVCTGTGKQASLRAYYDRTAILGKDPRGGAMALLVATELAALARQTSN